MAELKRMIVRTLVTDTVDTSSSNPSLLTLSNRSPQRQQKGVTLSATTLNGATIAGAATFTVAAAGGLAPGQWVAIQDAALTGSFEIAQIAPGGVVGTVITPTQPLTLAHLSGALVSPLPTIVTDHEPRQPITGPEAYWRIVVGPYREFHDRDVQFRTPTRLYQAFCWVKVYDSEPSHKLPEDVVNRLDYLLNLGESSAAQGLGSSPVIYLEKTEIVEVPDPSFDHATQSHQIPVLFRFVFSRIFV